MKKQKAYKRTAKCNESASFYNLVIWLCLSLQMTYWTKGNIKPSTVLTYCLRRYLRQPSGINISINGRPHNQFSSVLTILFRVELLCCRLTLLWIWKRVVLIFKFKICPLVISMDSGVPYSCATFILCIHLPGTLFAPVHYPLHFTTIQIH